MIAAVRGIIIGRAERSVTLDVHGVGMQIFVPPRVLDKAKEKNVTVTLHTHLHVREDALELYGFLELPELRLFEKLIDVNGVGPRMALGVLSAAGVADLEGAIESGQSSLLTKVSGIGKKTAERIIVDLRGKLSNDHVHDDSDVSAVIDTLVHLGYSSREAREAATATPDSLSVEQRVKAALQRMGK